MGNGLIVLVALFEFDTLIGLLGFLELIANIGDSMNSMNQLNSLDFPLPEGFWWNLGDQFEPQFLYT